LSPSAATHATCTAAFSLSAVSVVLLAAGRGGGGVELVEHGPGRGEHAAGGEAGEAAHRRD